MNNFKFENLLSMSKYELATNMYGASGISTLDGATRTYSNLGSISKLGKDVLCATALVCFVLLFFIAFNNMLNAQCPTDSIAPGCNIPYNGPFICTIEYPENSGCRIIVNYCVRLCGSPLTYDFFITNVIKEMSAECINADTTGLDSAMLTCMLLAQAESIDAGCDTMRMVIMRRYACSAMYPIEIACVVTDVGTRTQSTRYFLRLKEIPCYTNSICWTTARYCLEMTVVPPSRRLILIYEETYGNNVSCPPNDNVSFLELDSLLLGDSFINHIRDSLTAEGWSPAQIEGYIKSQQAELFDKYLGHLDSLCEEPLKIPDLGPCCYDTNNPLNVENFKEYIRRHLFTPDGFIKCRGCN